MLFNSLNFAFFLPIVFIIYWFLCGKSNRNKNTVLLIASYIFYAFWDWRFLFLLVFSTALDYFSGIKIDKSQDKIKKSWLVISVAINLGFLGIFKYFNFFIESFSEALTVIGIHTTTTTLNIILPVGISFYTFHGLSYVFDIYNKKIKPEYNFISYSLFVSFFPLLVAGPIERATHLLPQLKRNRDFDYNLAKEGLRQMLWGFFKKIVIADNCAIYANEVFNNSSQYNGSTLLFGAIFFAFQIYGDFSGYTDIATGTSKLFGINLVPNFKFPYFSRDIAEFWRRWHISLSSWFRDYIYIPLGGNSGSKLLRVRNICVIFLISGFWHGANWTFLIWGALHAIYIIPLFLFNINRNNINVVAINKILPSLKELIQMLTTFILVTIAWIFFRSDTVIQAFSFIRVIFSKSLFQLPTLPIKCILSLFFVGIMIVFEWFNRSNTFGIEKLIENRPRIYRWLIYIFIIFMIIGFGGSEEGFIYFQF